MPNESQSRSPTRKLVDEDASSLVVRDLSPQKVYSKNVEQHMMAVPPLFRKPPGQLHHLRPIRTPEVERQETLPQKPKLLQDIEALLEKKLRTVEQKAATYGPLRASWAESMLRLDVYRQVFQVLASSMTTYKPILQKVARQYDAAFESALRASYEHIYMAAELAEADSRRREAVEATLAECTKNAVQMRDQLLQQVVDTEASALEAESTAARAEAAVKDARHQLWNLQNKRGELQKENLRLRTQMETQSSLGRPGTE